MFRHTVTQHLFIDALPSRFQATLLQSKLQRQANDS